MVLLALLIGFEIQASFLPPLSYLALRSKETQFWATLVACCYLGPAGHQPLLPTPFCEPLNLLILRGFGAFLLCFPKKIDQEAYTPTRNYCETNSENIISCN